MRKAHVGRHAAIAACLALSMAAAACSSSEPEPSEPGQSKKAAIKVMLPPGQSFRLPVLVAEAEGYFEDRGVGIDIVEQPANLQAFQGLEATNAQIALLTVGTLSQAVQAGEKGAYFCGGIDVLQTSLMVPPDSDLPTTEKGATWQEALKSLSGKKVGIQTPVGSALQLVFKAALDEADVSDVTFVNLGPSPSAAQAALANGSVDAAQSTPTGTQYLVSEGHAKPMLYLPDGPETYGEFYGSGWGAPSEWLDGNEESAAAFCAAVEDALTYIQDPANREKSSQLLQKDTGIPGPVADLAIDSAYDDYATDLSDETVQRTISAYTDLGILKKDPEVSAEKLIKKSGG